MLCAHEPPSKKPFTPFVIKSFFAISRVHFRFDSLSTFVIFIILVCCFIHAERFLSLSYIPNIMLSSDLFAFLNLSINNSSLISHSTACLGFYIHDTFYTLSI